MGWRTVKYVSCHYCGTKFKGSNERLFCSKKCRANYMEAKYGNIKHKSKRDKYQQFELPGIF